MHQVKRLLASYLPFWIVLIAWSAFQFPNVYGLIQGFAGVGLGLIFLLMGMQLAVTELRKTIKRPRAVFIGVALKWVIMVSVSVGLATLFFRNQPELAMGIIVSGTVPSGTSANLYAFIAGGDVALSITMATLDTVISPVLTPLLTDWFAGKLIPLDLVALFQSILLIVFIPLFSGIFLQWKWSSQVDRVKPYTPVISQVTLLLIVASVVSSAQPSLVEHVALLPKIAGVVFLQVSIPMLLGYGLAKVLGVGEAGARSILFQVGICNTALAATLAMAHIGALAAIPAVMNMIINLSLGAFVSNYFSSRPSHAV